MCINFKEKMPVAAQGKYQERLILSTSLLRGTVTCIRTEESAGFRQKICSAEGNRKFAFDFRGVRIT